MRLKRTAAECVECGAVLVEHVWLDRGRPGGVWWTTQLPYCGACWEPRDTDGGYAVPRWRQAPRTSPCVVCGRLVTAGWHPNRQLWTCGELCAERFRRRREPEPRDCERCGERFWPARSDGRYCSSACRQRAYRERHAT